MEILKIDVAGAPGPDGAAGESGSAGSDGQSGDRGRKGKSGKNGKSGANGSSARNGRDGGKGSHGLKLEIEIGSDEEGDYICKTNRGNLGPGLYGFDASGGDGGSGGNGGHGGGGGDGGSGGAGDRGASGKSGKRKKDGSKGPGTKGKDGGNGGNGGNGGKGGSGGDGGDGQNGGNGADITLRASDLLALHRVVRLDARGGVAGRAGSRGAAGTAGSAGSAGTAGSGGSGGSGSPSGSRGASGNRGAGGTVGLRGQGGAGGASGSAGSNGRVFVKVKDGNRELSKEYVGFAQRHDLFGVTFALQWQKMKGVQDGVLSPGDTFQLKGKVGLPAESFPLPGGGCLGMRQDAEKIERIDDLPAIKPGESVDVATQELEVPYGQIGEKLEYELRAYDSLDVPFKAKGGIVEIEPTWPIQVEFSAKEIALGSGGVSEALQIRLKNVSSITYGDEEHSIEVKVQVEADKSSQQVKFMVDGGDAVDQITLKPTLKAGTEAAYELIIAASDQFSSSHQISLKMDCNDYSIADKIEVKHDTAVKNESKRLFSPKVGRYLISPWVAVYNSRRMTLLFTAASAVLWADGTREKEEQEVFYKVLESIKLRERERKRLANLIETKPSKFQLRSMARNTYPPDHLAAYAFATHMALADGELQESELEVLAWMEKKFKIDEAQAGEIRKIAKINHKTFGFRVVDLYMSTISSWTMLAKVPLYSILMGVFGLFVWMAKYSVWIYDVIRFDKVPELAVAGEAKKPDRALRRKLLSLVVLGGLAGGGVFLMAPRLTSDLSAVRESQVVKDFEAYLNTLRNSLLASDQEVGSEGKLAPAPGVLMSVDETQQWLSSGAKWHEAAWRASGCPEQVDRGWVADPNKRADFYRVIRTDVKLGCGTE